MRLLLFILGHLTIFPSSISGDTSPFQLFGHNMIRVQRSATEHLRNHRLHNHQRERRNRDRSVTKCPPPMTRLPDNACMVDPCHSDSECTKHGQKCCYNGCLFACVHVVHPPPVIDWQTQKTDTNVGGSFPDLQPPEYEGNLEFNIIPGEMLAESHRGGLIGEICSTTVDDGDILMDCPHGYICHIENQGDPTKGVPNRGVCVEVDEHAPVNAPALENDYFY